MSNEFFDTLLNSSKNIGAGIATVGLVGAGAGVGIVFAGLMLAFGRNPSLKNELFERSNALFSDISSLKRFVDIVFIGMNQTKDPLHELVIHK